MPLKESVEEHSAQHVKLPSRHDSTGKEIEFAINDSPLDWESFRDTWGDDGSSNADDSSEISANQSFVSILHEIWM